MWKTSSGSRQPIKLDPNVGYTSISPDGRWIAFQTWGENGKGYRIKIVASDGNGSPRFLPFPNESQIPESVGMGDLPIRWTADGKSITYVRTQHGASNIWVQPIDGSPAKQLTTFTSMYIWRHAWSSDGKWLVMARGNFSRDAVMLTDVR
jgi:Tol biopolymer transport system component